MSKKRKIHKFSESDEWGAEVDQRKRYDKKKQARRKARQQKQKLKNSFLDQE